jgi:hypothetical protein
VRAGKITVYQDLATLAASTLIHLTYRGSAVEAGSFDAGG